MTDRFVECGYTLRAFYYINNNKKRGEDHIVLKHKGTVILPLSKAETIRRMLIDQEVLKLSSCTGIEGSPSMEVNGSLYEPADDLLIQLTIWNVYTISSSTFSLPLNLKTVQKKKTPLPPTPNSPVYSTDSDSDE
jgi:hypothetical protein